MENIYYMPVVISIFCIYFSFIQRRIVKNYEDEYERKVQILKNKGEDNEKVNEEWERLKNKYNKLSNHQFSIFILALSKCFLSYENIILFAMFLYGFNVIYESYRLYKLDYKYRLRESLKNNDDKEKTISIKHELQAKFNNIAVNYTFYTLSQIFGYYCFKSKKFWEVSVYSNPFNNSSKVINFLFAYKNVISFYALYYTLYVIAYRVFVEKIYKVFDENFRLTFRSLFKIKQNKNNLYIYLVVSALCLMRSVLIY